MLLVAFVVAPAVLAGGGYGSVVDNRPLERAVVGGFTDYLTSDSDELTPHLRAVVDYWFRFHVVKAILAALLLLALAALAVALRRSRQQLDSRPGVYTAAIVTVWTFATGAALAAMANIQGAVAPLSSTLSLLPSDRSDSRLAASLDEARQRLAAGSVDTGHPALERLIDDFVTYHAVFAALAAAAVLAVLALGLRLARLDDQLGSATRRRWRRGIVTATAVIALLVVAVANLTTALSPEPALITFLQG